MLRHHASRITITMADEKQEKQQKPKADKGGGAKQTAAKGDGAPKGDGKPKEKAPRAPRVAPWLGPSAAGLGVSGSL